MSTPFKQIKNNARSNCTSGGLNNTTDPVTFNVSSGHGSRFPTNTSAPNGFWITAWDNVTYQDPGDDPNMEILLATSRSGDAITASRGQLNTIAVAHTGTPAIRLLLVDKQVQDIQTAINAVETLAVMGV